MSTPFKTNKNIILLIGNPGVGKSTIANTLLGEVCYESGYSENGAGITVTKQFQEIPEGRLAGNLIGDTPGLQDSKMQKQAAKQIEMALKSNTDYKIAFVMTLESGRVKAQDQASINAVLSAVKTEFEYGVIMNQVPEKRYENTQDSQLVIDCLNVNVKRHPKEVAYLVEEYSIKDEDNMLMSDGNRKLVEDFLVRLPFSRIKEEDVSEVEVVDAKVVSEMRDKMAKLIQENREREEKHKREIKDFKNNISTLETEVKNGRKELKGMKERFEKDMDAMDKAAKLQAELALKEAETRVAKIEADAKLEREKMRHALEMERARNSRTKKKKGLFGMLGGFLDSILPF